MRARRFLFIQLLVVTLLGTGCGGGPGGESDQDREEAEQVVGPRPEPPEDPAQPLSYAGAPDKATLNGSNITDFVYMALHSYFTKIGTVSLDFSGPPLLEHLGRNMSEWEYYSWEETYACDSGKVDATYDVNQIGDGYVLLAFRQCAMDEITLQGRVTVNVIDLDGQDALDIADGLIAFNRLSVTAPEGQYTYSGSMEYRGDREFAVDVVIRREQDGRIFRFSDYREKTNQYHTEKSLVGRLYDSVLGWSYIRTDSLIKFGANPRKMEEIRIGLRGADTSWATAVFWNGQGGVIQFGKDSAPNDASAAFVTLDGLRAADNADLADSDGDGLHDSWEIEHGHDPDTPDADATDTDGDGVSDVIERLSGSAPDDATDYPEFVDVTVALTGSPDPATAGNPFDMTVEVTNLGTVEALEMTAVVELPPDTMVNVEGTPCTVDEQQVSCPFSRIGPGSSYPRTFKLTPPWTPTTLNTQASVSTSGIDIDHSNNRTAETTVTEPPTADLQITLTENLLQDSPGWFDTGIELDSPGPQAAGPTELAFTLPPEVELNSVSLSRGGCTGEVDVVCTIEHRVSDVDGYGTTYATGELSLRTDTPGIYRIPIAVSHAGTDPDPSNNSVVFSSYIGRGFPTDILSAIYDGGPDDTVEVPPGYYYLRRDFINPISTRVIAANGPDETFISLGEGLSLAGGEIAGFTFTHSNGPVRISNASGTLRNNVFRVNDTRWSPSPRFVFIEESADVILDGNVFRDNYCRVHDLMYSLISGYWLNDFVILRNNLFVNNECTAVGLGNYPYQTFTAVIANNTFVDNTKALGISYSDMESASAIDNNVLVGNQTGLSTGYLYCDSDCPPVRSNLIYDNDTDYAGIDDQTGINGNISADPLFADPANGDYSLQAGSPGIDAGDPANTTAVDIKGNPRTVDGDASGTAEPDIGAYERQ